MQFKVNFIVSLTFFLILSCKEKEEKPKVIYEEAPKEAVTKKDTTQIRVADLPVFMNGTSYFIHPVGELRVYDIKSKSSYGSTSTSNVSHAVSNYNRFEITGYLDNLFFQHIDSSTSKPLTDKQIIIQSATYLHTIAEKSKKQIMVYTVADMDTNRDSKLDQNDIKSLFLSLSSGENFTKLTPDYQELIDWNILEVKNRLYLRTIQDSNKNGDFDKDDAVFYYYIDLLDKDWKLNEYKPYN